LPKKGSSAITRPLAARLLGLPWQRHLLNQQTLVFRAIPGRRSAIAVCQPHQESQMPKLKTKSGAKKRFKITGSGKVVSAQAGKRHGMIKRTTKQIRNLRGTRVMFKADGENIKKYWMPNG
jgi:large subunit ribosomal protein L35